MPTTEYSIHSTSEGVFVAKGYRMIGQYPAVDFRVSPFFAPGPDALAAYKALVAEEN